MVTSPADLEDTKILVAPSADRKQQLTVYSNLVKNKSATNAMILPVVAPHSVKFINLSKYNDIFEDCDKSFPVRFAYDGNDEEEGITCFSMNESYLEVQDVGSYKCSVANSIADLQRVDPRVFTITQDFVDVLTQHYDAQYWGFIICKIRDGATDSFEEYHPIAYTHSLIGGKLFIPTRHYHGTPSANPQVANDWDHTIYVHNASIDCEIPDGRWGKYTTMETNKCKVAWNSVPGFTAETFKRFFRYKINGTFDNKDLLATLVSQQYTRPVEGGLSIMNKLKELRPVQTVLIPNSTQQESATSTDEHVITTNSFANRPAVNTQPPEDPYWLYAKMSDMYR